jgi:tetratricopeptide (TPR) repeat protein
MSLSAEAYLLKAIQLEVKKEYNEAIIYYKKAYYLNPDLQFRIIDRLIVDNVVYDRDGEKIEDIENKVERYPYCFDLPNVSAEFIIHSTEKKDNKSK